MFYYPLYPVCSGVPTALINSCKFIPYTMVDSRQNQPPSQSPYPPVNIQKFDISARQFQKLMEQARLFINQIVKSDKFARDLMEAAQRSDQKTVEKMIRTTGIQIHFRVSFTPTAIQIIFDNSTEQMACCQLLVGLQW